jgi:hypothetical protein
VGDGSRCLTAGGSVSPCNHTGQKWGPPAPIDGFFQLSGGRLKILRSSSSETQPGHSHSPGHDTPGQTSEDGGKASTCLQVETAY